MRRYILFIYTILLVVNANAQRKIQQIDPEKEEVEKNEPTFGQGFWQKVSYGGNVSMRFSNENSFITLQPLMFYPVSQKATLGGGFSYYYYKQTYIVNGLKQVDENHAYGLNMFGRYEIFSPLFIHAEYNPMNFEVYQPITNELKREWVNSLMVGGGINQRINNRSGFYILALYDILYNQNRSFRANALEMRVGFYL